MFSTLLFSTMFLCCNEHSTPPKQLNSNTSSEHPSSLREVSVPQLFTLTAQSEPIIIDVRTEREFKSGHIPSAQNIPMSELSDRLNDLEQHKNKDIYLVCAVGGRSGQAQKYLNPLGFSTINVMGGTKEWKEKKYPIELPE